MRLLNFLTHRFYLFRIFQLTIFKPYFECIHTQNRLPGYTTYVGCHFRCASILKFKLLSINTKNNIKKEIIQKAKQRFENLSLEQLWNPNAYDKDLDKKF